MTNSNPIAPELSAHHDGSTPPYQPIPLSTLADFHPGLRVRRRQLAPDGSIAVIRKRDIVRGKLNPELERAHLPNLPAALLLRAGDVILHSHLACFTPVVVDAPNVCMTVAAPLVIIRIRQSATLLPQYLAWYLQTSAGQKALASYLGQGAAVEVAIEGLYRVALRLPPPDTQQVIEGMYQLYRRCQQQAALTGQTALPIEAVKLETLLLRLARLG